MLGAATVVLGRGAKGPDLKYDGLRPGIPQEVELRVDYEGSVPADISLAIGPKGDSPLCSRIRDQRSVAAPGRAFTIRVGEAPAVSYCSLAAGTRLPVAAGVAPDSRATAGVVVSLAGDFVPPEGGLSVSDVATVHADGGFTDAAIGTIDLRVEGPGKGAPAAVPATPTVVSAVGEADAVVIDAAADPASAARAVEDGKPIALPAQCAAAGMSASDLAEVVVLDPERPSWSATTERGAGAGPFLVLGTAGADTVAGSDRADCIVGGAGDDRLSGSAGADVILGDGGSDTLNGDDGNDQLDGGRGHDTLLGGPGADRLAGGLGGAVCDVTPADRTAGCDPPSPVVDAAVPAPSEEPLRPRRSNRPRCLRHLYRRPMTWVSPNPLPRTRRPSRSLPERSSRRRRRRMLQFPARSPRRRRQLLDRSHPPANQTTTRRPRRLRLLSDGLAARSAHRGPNDQPGAGSDSGPLTPDRSSNGQG